MNKTRREFIKQSALLGATTTLIPAIPSFSFSEGAKSNAGKPIIISSANGKEAIKKAMEMIQQGSDALDAVIAGVNIVEDDPNDMSVGYGGLPNEEGVVE
ncbi:MAG: isoaspartyl peptidase/L-asparaginase, partial [Ignavibacteriales bacterium]|nr:isoaspartyl peptidase/L-asparaginase [Ignavibacteriales bacterium]